MRSQGRHSGFSLIEITLALGVAAFCLVTVFALLPIALKIQSTSIGETGAVQVATAIEGDLRATPSAATTSPQFAIPIGTTTTMYFSNEGQPSAALTPQSKFRATITFTTNSVGVRGASLATVAVSWPAPATLANSLGSRSAFVALDRN